MLNNHHSSLREIAPDPDISYKSFRLILVHILGMRHVDAQFDPKEKNFLLK